MKRAKLTVGVVVGCAVLMLVTGCATSGGKGPTDEELIDALTEECMAALEAQDVDKLMTFFSEDFTSYEFADKDAGRAFIEDAKMSGFLDGIEVDLSQKEQIIEGNKASGGPVILNGSFGSISISLDGVKEEGGWKVVNMDVQM